MTPKLRTRTVNELLFYIRNSLRMYPYAGAVSVIKRKDKRIVTFSCRYLSFEQALNFTDLDISNCWDAREDCLSFYAHLTINTWLDSFLPGRKRRNWLARGVSI